ncbi:tyrosine-type recombinase/integrase [Sphingomonas sp. CROZ-RG-20F-R02-07]|uniref:tyrosine-type recombinase/integrase n=1 Tax=Sphingomonas sp. CROZ-RG-20F-R02-07 TaxID=2914832 RepID=UPI001F5ABEEB
MSTPSYLAPLQTARIAMPDGRRSWTVLDDDAEIVECFRHWIVHLEQTNASPNTIRAYARHVVDFANFLGTNGAGLRDVTVPLYDGFLAWRLTRHRNALPSPKLVRLRASPEPALAPATRNQIQLSIKSFYRFFNGTDNFAIDTADVAKAFDGHRVYKPFLEHISQRRTTRRKDRYLSGDPVRVQRRVTDKRLTPTEVLTMIKACGLARDAFLIVLLYNTGMRIGEALGLRHVDIDLAEKVIWVVPRDDNANGARAKSGRTRGIPVHDYVLNMYVDYLTSGEYLPAFEAGTEYVFANVKAGQVGRAMSLSYAYKLNSLLKRRTRTAFTWHMFRHSHASEAIAAGYSLLEVADRLGHASPQTTATFYQHLFASEVRKLYLTGPAQVQERLAHLREANLVGKDVRWA